MRKATIKHLENGEDISSGLVVVIDVLRACTTAAYLLKEGAARIIPVSEVEDAWQMKEVYSDAVLIGERNGRPLAGFDCGNSPSEISRVNVTDKAIVFTTTAGTKGVFAARHAEIILLGSFVNFSATVEFIRNNNIDPVYLLPMGLPGGRRAVEDELCACLLSAAIAGESVDLDSIKSTLASAPELSKFFDVDDNVFHEADFHCAMEINSFKHPIVVHNCDQTNHLIIKQG